MIEFIQHSPHLPYPGLIVVDLDQNIIIMMNGDIGHVSGNRDIGGVSNWRRVFRFIASLILSCKEPFG